MSLCYEEIIHELFWQWVYKERTCWDFYFRNQLIWASQSEKQTEGLETNSDQKNYSENITAAPAARCCMRLLVSV